MNSFKSPKTFLIKTSLQKVLLIAIPHLVAFLMMFFAYKNMPIGLALLVFLLIIVSMSYYFELHLLRTRKRSVVEIRQDSVNNWFILCNSYGNSQNDYVSANLLGTSFVSQYLIVINFVAQPNESHQKNKQQYTVLVTPDSLTKDEFRQLKVRLKLMKTWQKQSS